VEELRLDKEVYEGRVGEAAGGSHVRARILAANCGIARDHGTEHAGSRREGGEEDCPSTVGTILSIGISYQVVTGKVTSGGAPHHLLGRERGTQPTLS